VRVRIFELRLIGLALLDRMPRRHLQILGFGLSALSMLLIAAIPGLTSTVVPFALVFGVSLFGIALGPNYTTMLLAAESYPTPVGCFVLGIATTLLLREPRDLALDDGAEPDEDVPSVIPATTAVST